MYRYNFNKVCSRCKGINNSQFFGNNNPEYPEKGIGEKVDKKVLIVVPAFNEEKNIFSVVSEIRESLPKCDILVINDCSTDNTSAEAKQASNVKVVDLPSNLGIGGAVQTGFKYAARNNYEYVIQVDGDGQHIADEAPKLFEAIETKGCDMVIGSRFLGIKSFETTRARRMGIKVFYFLYKLMFRTRVTDSTSGFRIYNRKCVDYLSSNYPDDYPEPEVIVMLKRKGFDICEVGVRMRERSHGRSSITPLKSSYYMIKVIMSIFFSYIREHGRA